MTQGMGPYTLTTYYTHKFRNAETRSHAQKSPRKKHLLHSVHTLLFPAKVSSLRQKSPLLQPQLRPPKQLFPLQLFRRCLCRKMLSLLLLLSFFPCDVFAASVTCLSGGMRGGEGRRRPRVPPEKSICSKMRGHCAMEKQIAMLPKNVP